MDSAHGSMVAATERRRERSLEQVGRLAFGVRGIATLARVDLRAGSVLMGRDGGGGVASAHGLAKRIHWVAT